MIKMAELLRHHRNLIWNADDGLLLWKIARKTPEGVTCGVCRSEKGKEILEQYGRTLGDLDKPILLFRPESDKTDYLMPEKFREVIYDFQYKGAVFDRIFFRDPFISKESITALAQSFEPIFKEKPEDSENHESPFAEGFKIIVSQRIPSGGQRISALIREQILNSQTYDAYREILEKMSLVEKEFFGNAENALFNWNEDFIAEQFRTKGFTVKTAVKICREKRKITSQEVSRWFDSENSVYGSKISSVLGSNEIEKIILLLNSAGKNSIFNWQSKIAFFEISL